MTKAVKKISDKDAEFLNKIKERNASSKPSSPQMAQLAINTDSVDAEGKRIQPGTFYIKGSANYSETVEIIPIEIYTYYKRTTQDAKGNFKTDCETIFARQFETPIDNKGGIACGRLLGKSVPEHWSAIQKKENREKAAWYVFLFGLVKFPGSTEYTLVNFRAPKAKAMLINDAVKKLDKDRLFDNVLKLKLIPVKGKPHPSLEVSVEKIEHENYDLISSSYHTTLEFVDAHNSRINVSRERIKENLKSAGVYASVVGDDSEDLSADFEEEDEV
jgi:hypothetical protein